MGILEFIRNLFSNGKTNTKIITKDFEKVYKEDGKLEVALYDVNKNPLSNKEIIININNVDYSKKTDENGIARLNINLLPGEYKAYFKFKGDDEYNQSTGYAKVYVNVNIESKDLNMAFKDGSKFEIKVKDKDNNPLSNIKVKFNVNGSNYERISDENGIVSLTINLPAGKYDIITQVGNNKVNNIINIDKDITRMEGTDINMSFKDGTTYQCAVYDSRNRRVIDKVTISINGVNYIRDVNEEGLAKLNINLNPGTYIIKALFKGNNNYKSSEVSNTINISQREVKPETTNQSYELHDYFTSQGGGYLGQKTGYTCGPHSLMQCIHRLTGEDVSEMELASVAGTTSEGTDHDGLATALAWFNNKYGYNLKMTWKNFSEVGFEGTQQLIDNGACFHHILYRNQYGHYEVPKFTKEDPIYVLNSLGDNCGNGYCGYIEERWRSTHQSYINGISQKSVCIITR